MTMVESRLPGVEHGFGLGRKVYGSVAARRWINPALWALGALALLGYLMIGHPATTLVTTPALAPVAQDELARSSVLDAALGTVLAAGWLLAGAWIGCIS